MTDPFHETDPYTEKIIEENEERAEERENENGDTGFAKKMDDFFEPIFGSASRLVGDRDGKEFDEVEPDKK